MQDVLLTDWLEQLAAKQPTPGGGGVAALQAATAAALVGMVSIYTTGERWANVSDSMQHLSDQAADYRQQALDLITADAEAFAGVGVAYKLPKDTEQQQKNRQTAIQAALVAAAQPPSQVIELTIKIIELSQQLVEAGNPSVISDVAVAASTAKAALEAAMVNVVINQVSITDDSVVQSLGNSIEQAKAGLSQAGQIVEVVTTKINGAKS